MAQNLSNQKNNRSVQVIKLFCILILIPLVIGFVIGLIEQIGKLAAIYAHSLYWGIAIYLLFHILINEPVKFYKRTQRFIQVIFGFFSPLFKVTYYIIPFWVIVIIGFFVLLCEVFNIEYLVPLFFFLSGFLFTMHIVMVAKISKVDKIHKIIDYLFIILLVIIINIFFFGLNLKLYSSEFSVLAVGQRGLETGMSLVKAIWGQLFIPEING